MSELRDQLLDPDRRAAVVADACDLIDGQVARTGGVSGFALRSAYRVVQGVKPGAVPRVVDELLPSFLTQMEGYHELSRDSGRPLAEVLSEDPAGVADSLLAVADARVARTRSGSGRAAYRRVRGRAHGHVVAALPGAARIVEKHAPAPPGSSGEDSDRHVGA